MITLTRLSTPIEPGFEEERINRSLSLQVILEDSWHTFKLQQSIKRGVDILLASSGLFMLLPAFLGIGALVKLTSPGPIFYKSLRVGKGYEPFYMYKFRTMQVHADRFRDVLREKANLQGHLFKLQDDPRVTSFGKILRSLSLDELPQLINVLRGEMSLVGPRPLPPDESAYFKEPYTVRFQVLPGITGAWQVNGRSALSFQQLSELEMSYVLKWSLYKDFQLLFKTLPAVLKSKGAY